MKQWHVLFALSLVSLLLLGACTPAPASGPAPSLAAGSEAAAPSEVPAEPLPVNSPAVTTDERSITLDEPRTGETLSGAAHVRGSVAVAPFESMLRGRVYDASGAVMGEGPVMVAAEMGQPGAFEGTIPFRATTGGPGYVEVAELSPKDGAAVLATGVNVVLAASEGTGGVEIPSAGEHVTLPLRILARLGRPGEEVTATLRWQDGTELVKTFLLLEGEDGSGLLIASLNWPGESQPPEPPTQAATLSIATGAGSALRQEVVVLGVDDPDTTAVKLYFLLGEDLQDIQVRIPKTPAIATATLEQLLWGPPSPNLAGFGTSIPTPEQVLAFPGRQAEWGPRVRLLSLAIDDGVAMADFSREMEAYGGGSLRVKLLRDQITQTLKQFPTVQQVIIAVEGETETVLQP
ncbi:MAG TPA: Gmad2 immunoglobulin-like domain-containing protein [Anaerolineae bacterium]|nr:Gmad2 immunoglobulin-like domain-containing protein [Anaerolineae bacterium]